MIVQVFHCPWSIFSVIFSKLQPGRLSISRVTFHGDWSRQRLAVLGSPHRYLGDAKWSLNGRNITGWTTGISLETVGILEGLKCSKKNQKNDPSEQSHCKSIVPGSQTHRLKTVFMALSNLRKLSWWLSPFDLASVIKSTAWNFRIGRGVQSTGCQSSVQMSSLAWWANSCLPKARQRSRIAWQQQPTNSACS